MCLDSMPRFLGGKPELSAKIIIFLKFYHFLCNNFKLATKNK